MFSVERDGGSGPPNPHTSRHSAGRIVVILVGITLLLTYSMVAAHVRVDTGLAMLAGSTGCALAAEAIRAAIAANRTHHAADEPEAGPATPALTEQPAPAAAPTTEQPTQAG